MDDLEQKLNSVLSNPQLMQQIMSMAQSMGGPPPQSEPVAQPPQPSLPSFDPKLLQAVSGLAQQSGVDQNQQSLLKALHPYLSTDRITRLEKAMRAAKMARLASTFFGQNSLMSLLGR